MRVVSLLRAATEIVAALGAADRLVGVSHECDWPQGAVRGRLRVTRTWVDTSQPSGAIDRQVTGAGAAGRPPIEVDLDALHQARPDVIIGQAVCDVCAVGAGAGTDTAATALFAAARVELLDGNVYTSRPGPRLVEGAELLARLIHR